MTFELHPPCLVVDKDKDVGDVVDAVEDGPGVVLFIGQSEVLITISEGRFEVYNCPPRMEGYGTVVTGSS